MSDNQPLVSVITPTYNRADFIREAVESVLAQSYPHFEFLIVDDGSTDNTSEVLEPYLKDERVRLFWQENQGQSVARNVALAQARGEFVCFLDSDNYWPTDKLEAQVRLFKEYPETDVLYGDNVIINEQGDEVSRDNMSRYSGRIARHMIKDNCVAMNTTMARRHCFDELGGMSGKRRVADDYDLWLRFSAKYQFRYEPEYWAWYRVMEDQISSDKTQRFKVNEAIIRDFRRDYREALGRSEFDDGFAHFFIRKGRYLASVGKRQDGLREIFKAVRYAPANMNVWRALLAVMFKRHSQ
ncbi:MAG: Glycosyltransferases involved in cell wall biogenesis [Marinobacter excellens HL-55]|uniref:Glycosyltransferases involved in cell wall biogenesis n=1 Tax=Marinobacter excellens HL-55 TaxID=1305731 RepID=A0A0P7YLJ6_9GAMM|nr:MAG: Glycosyltransferases involved in cell wall biogenesis [Marinobacter excellens HL-55]